MDINKVINIIRESKKASKCPPGYKLDKKTKTVCQLSVERL